MRLEAVLCAAAVLAATGAFSATPTSLAALRWTRRVVLISAPNANDPKAVAQRRTLAEWSREAADRDVTVVEIAGSRVTGASDEAAALRQRYRLDSGVFQVLLIGKDGHVALRSAEPVGAATLQSAIDAMPMRRAGER